MIKHDFPDDLSVSSSSDSAGPSGSSCDELKEVRKLVSKEESKIRIWRVIVALAIVVIGGVVTWMTYYFVASEEKKNFENVVSFPYCQARTHKTYNTSEFRRLYSI